jgi:hypothetical protein
MCSCGPAEIITSCSSKWSTTLGFYVELQHGDDLK